MNTFKNKKYGYLKIVFLAFSSILLILLTNFGVTFSQLDSDIDSFETIYEDDFSNEKTDWYLNPIQEDWGSVDFSITDGTYRWEMNLEKSQYNYNSVPSTINLPEDYFRISVDIQFESACSGCDAGIVFNLQDKNNFYFASVDSQGVASLYAKENNKWILLSEKIQSQKFDPSGFNNMAVVFDQGNYEIRINDIPTIQLADSRFHGGNVALLLEGRENTNPVIRFDNLKVMKKKSIQSEKKAEAEISKLDSDIDSFETIYEDDFSNEITDWDLNPIQTDRGIIDFSITDGTYRWNMDTQTGWFSYIPIPSKINLPEDGFRISVDIQFESACSGCGAGIIYNLQDSRNYYFARIDSQGLVCVYSLENNKWNLLSEVIQSQKFDPSAFNNLTVIFDQGIYEIQINNIPTIQLADSRFHSGDVGLAIEGRENTNPVTRFDNLTVMKKKSIKPVELSKEKTNVDVKSEFKSESSAHLNQVVNPMNDLYPPQENVAFTKFFLDFSSPVTFWREGRGDIFCLKESDEKACVFIVQHFDNWDSPKAAANDILNKYAQQVKNFEIFDQHETFSADGYPAYRAGAHFSIGGINYETDHLFIRVNDEVFQIMSYATRGIIEKYRQDLNHIMESFSLSSSE